MFLGQIFAKNAKNDPAIALYHIVRFFILILRGKLKKKTMLKILKILRNFQNFQNPR